jgi:MarR family transcriptional regulator, organic hydroperoxide resistance regulator
VVFSKQIRGYCNDSTQDKKQSDIAIYIAINIIDDHLYSNSQHCKLSIKISSVRPNTTFTSHRHKQLAVDVLKQFRRIYGSVRQHFREIEQTCGVSGSQLWIIQELSKTPGIGVSELATRLSIHQSTCSQLVEKLVARGYVVKTRLRQDQRRVGLSISKQANKLLANAPGPAEGLLPEALMGLPDASLRSLSTSLDKLAGQLRQRDDRFAERPLSDL